MTALKFSKNMAGTCSNGKWTKGKGTPITSYNPATGKVIGSICPTDAKGYASLMKNAQKAFEKWRVTPAPARGEVVRQIGEALRQHKEPLGRLISEEMGKIYQEGLGEVQEAIDIADYAVGLSRQLFGVTTHSERPGHRLYEQWHPLGHIGIITAFNFPMAVWAWNAMIAAVAGNVMTWKPSSKTPFCAVAIQNIVNDVLKKNGHPGVMNLAIGGSKDLGEWMIADRRFPLISATGSCRMGRRINEVVGTRLGKTLLELGGNNAALISKHANVDLALRAVVFGAVGTAGQRCTSTRRLFLHKNIEASFTKKLIAAYKQITIGDPTKKNVLMGPLIDQGAVDDMDHALAEVQKQGGKLLYGGGPAKIKGLKGSFVTPAIVKVTGKEAMVREETFAPILYVHSFTNLDQAIAQQNSVDQGLSSSLFTENLLEAESFLSAAGSDCGIANINAGTSGAEIGLAFGGEKDTGGGREAGSDSWKVYMRRQTNTINYSTDLPLAQGIKFGK